MRIILDRHPPLEHSFTEFIKNLSHEIGWQKKENNKKIGNFKLQLFEKDRKINLSLIRMVLAKVLPKTQLHSFQKMPQAKLTYSN